MIEAVIFDMDGVIIDSEPFWIEAEIEIYNKYGIEMTEEMSIEMKGAKTADVVKHWHSIYQWDQPSQTDLTNEIIEKVISIIKERGKAMPGLMGLLEYLQDNKVKIGLATSSLYRIIDVVMEKLQISCYFDGIHSSESEKNGKPLPDVYIGAAKKLGIKPKNCIAVEDSHIGLLSAKAAGMFTIALPDKHEYNHDKYNIANLKIKSLKEIIELDFQGKLSLMNKVQVDK
jgi:mannitol-1-/sugar-/sorbitol-6-/2-deoxyglucose-6-phosphatase